MLSVTKTDRFDVPITTPGELQLPHDITRLGEKIDPIPGSISGSPHPKGRTAELTGDLSELKLTRSKASLAKEIEEMTFQKTQYEE